MIHNKQSMIEGIALVDIDPSLTINSSECTLCYNIARIKMAYIYLNCIIANAGEKELQNCQHHSRDLYFTSLLLK